MGEGGTQGNKVQKFALNDLSVSTVLSKTVGEMRVRIWAVCIPSCICLGTFFAIGRNCPKVPFRA